MDSNIVMAAGTLHYRLGDVAAYFYLHDEEMTADTVVRFNAGLERIVSFLEGNDTATEDEIQTEFYESAKVAFGDDRSSIRAFFRLMYILVLQTNSGPRWGQFVAIFGINEFLLQIRDRLSNPFGF